MKINNEKMVAEVSLKENATYVVSEGKLIKADNPPKGFGKQVVSWQDGIPVRQEINYSKQI